MGCASSTPQPEPPKKPKKGKGKGKADDPTVTAKPGTKVTNPLNGATEHATTQAPLGRDKYIGDAGALCMTGDQGMLLVFVPPSSAGLTLSFRDLQGRVFAKEYATDAQLEADRDALGIAATWAPFFKSIASDTIKGRVRIAASAQAVTATVNVVPKDAKNAKAFTMKLAPVASTGADMHRLFLEPLTRMVQRKRLTSDTDKEKRFAALECEVHVAQARMAEHRDVVNERKPVVAVLRNDASDQQREAFAVETDIGKLERRMKRLTKGQVVSTEGNTLDRLYDQGGPQYFQHVPAANEHRPQLGDGASDVGVAALLAVFPLQDTEHLAAKITAAPSNPQLMALRSSGDSELVDGVLRAMEKIDEWDYNVFDLERTTGNNALIYTTYAILLKLDLVNHFKIDVTVLRRFLRGLQSGYHPNPYHNATHAADVAQINYYIMVKGGLVERCKLSKEELLAGVLAGAIHDYDHPGFNNSFHTRTNAYLSTLYNDRSILENHHCACIYEMLRKKEYNIFAPLSEEQKKEVRDTMVEMVLSTDMGNHARIFGQFRRRQGEDEAWAADIRKDDVRLALSISIKMADISNCGRPNHLYLEWAKNIAAEFYVQGDAEATLGINISPFMDRRKGNEDFPKGQVSFMKFIVLPMFEAIVEFLPKMEFCLQHCNDNRDYWRRHEEES